MDNSADSTFHSSGSSLELEQNFDETTDLYLSRKMAIEGVRESAERLKADFMEQMEVKLGAMINDVMHTMQKADVVDRYRKLTQPLSPLSTPDLEKKKGERPGKLNMTGKFQEKVFVSRPSPLTELLQVTHFKTIHHIFIATLILIMLHTVILDLVEQNTVDLGLVRLMWAFGRPQMTLTILLGLEFCGLVVLYPSFHFWSKSRHRVKSELTKMIDYMAVLCFLIFLTGMIYIPAAIMWNNPLPPASGATITMEQCRLLMKMYAFVRSNVPRVLSQRTSSPTPPRLKENKQDPKHNPDVCDKLVSSTCKGNDEDLSQETEGDISASTTSSPSSVKRRRMGERSFLLSASTTDGKYVENRKHSDSDSGSWNDDRVTFPSYSKYLYFYISPTLIYKDNYPRTSSIRWHYVAWSFGQVFGCIVYANFILSRYSTFYFINFGHPDHPMSVLQFCNAVFSMMMPGILCLVLGFYLLLHSWHNAFAEMLCFGDRLFYKDWWNCSSFHSYYKTWNILVHDWLHTYIFKEAWELGLAKYHKALPTILVFVISSIFHEYVLSFTFNFFFPVLLTIFGGFGLALAFVKTSESSVGNIFMWFGLIAGSGILVSTYTMEFYARLNCPAMQSDSTADFFTPRFWTCNAIVWK